MAWEKGYIGLSERNDLQKAGPNDGSLSTLRSDRRRFGARRLNISASISSTLLQFWASGQYCTLCGFRGTLPHIMSSPARRLSRTALHSPKRATSKRAVFDVKLFLESNGLGRKIAKFRRKETVFSQGDPAKNVIYIQEGGVKLTVVNTTGKEAVVEILGPGDFFGVRSLEASPSTRRLRLRLCLRLYSSLRKPR